MYNKISKKCPKNNINKIKKINFNFLLNNKKTLNNLQKKIKMNNSFK